jgi:cell division protein FtsB
MSKDREGKASFPRLWLFVLLVLGALVLGDLNQRMADARRLEKDATSLQAEWERLEEENERLEEEIGLANSEAYVERWAHQEAKMVREGEVLVILIGPENEEPATENLPEPDTPNLSSLEVWLKLIFGQ